MTVYIDQLLAYDNTGKTREVRSTDSIQLTGSIYSTSWLRVGSHPSNSFPSAAVAGAGSLIFDSTNMLVKMNDGSAWQSPAYRHSLQDAYDASIYTLAFPARINLSEYTAGPLVIDGVGTLGGNYTPSAVQILSGYSDYALYSGWWSQYTDLVIAAGSTYPGNEALAQGYGTLYLSGGTGVLVYSPSYLKLFTDSYAPIYLGGEFGYNDSTGNIYIGANARYDSQGRTVTIGTQSFTSTTNIRAGSGGINLSATGVLNFTTSSGNLTFTTSSGTGSVQASGNLSLTSSSGTATLQGSSLLVYGSTGATLQSFGTVNIYGGNNSALMTVATNTVSLLAPTVNVGTSSTTTAVNIGIRLGGGGSSSTLHYGPFTNDTYIRLGQFATASANFPSASSIAGALVYDSTTGQVKFSNGSVWTALATGGSGGSTLQQAYDSGNSIGLTSSRNLIVTAPGSGTAAISLAANAASTFTVASANLTLSTTTSGTLTLTGASGISATNAVTASNYVRVGNLATESFPSATGIAGAILFDSGTTSIKYSDGSAWQTFSSGAGNSLQSAYAVGNTITLTSARPLVVNGISTTNDFYVDTTGNIGIGTASPSTAKLHVRAIGAGGIAVPLLLESSTATDFVDVRLGSNEGGLRISASPTEQASVSTGAAVQLFGTSSSFPGQLYLDTGSHNSAAIIFRTALTSGNLTERMRINANGTVSIGTNSSTYSLHVQNDGQTVSGTSTVVLSPNLSNDNAVSVAVGKAVSTNNAALVSFTPSATAVNSYASLGLSGSPTSLNVQGSGRVGIATTAPSTRLHIGAEVTDDNNYVYDSHSLMVIHQTPTATATLNDPKETLLLARQGTSSQAYGAAGVFELSRYENSGVDARTRLDLKMAHTNFLTGSNRVMTWLSGGRVGINQTAPTYALDVTGAGRFTGNLTVGGGLTIVGGTTYPVSWATRTDGAGGNFTGGYFAPYAANGLVGQGGYATNIGSYGSAVRGAGVIGVGTASASESGPGVMGVAAALAGASGVFGSGSVGTNTYGVLGQGQGTYSGVRGTGGPTAGSTGAEGYGGSGGGVGLYGKGVGAYAGVYGAGAGSPTGALNLVYSGYAGVFGVGGVNSGAGNPGVVGQGSVGQPGGAFYGSLTDFADGLQAYGQNNGAGVRGDGQGSGYGGYFVAGTSGTALAAVARSTGTAAQRAATPALEFVRDSTSKDPDAGAAFQNKLLSKNTVKAWGRLRCGPSPLIRGGFNFASFSQITTAVTVTLAAAINPDEVTILVCETNWFNDGADPSGNYIYRTNIFSGTQFSISGTKLLWGLSAGAYMIDDFTTVGRYISFLVIGANP